MKLNHIFSTLVLSLLLSSCVVSKKKYEAMENAKLAADRKVRMLTGEKNNLLSTLGKRDATISSLTEKLKSLKSEYNNLKYDMSASNAQKSSQIDNLTKKLGNTIKNQENIQEKKEALENDLSWLKKDRNTKAQQITELQEKVKTLESDIEALRAENLSTTEAATAKADSTNQIIEDLTSEVNALKIRLERAQQLNDKMQEQLRAKPTTTTR